MNRHDLPVWRQLRLLVPLLVLLLLGGCGRFGRQPVATREVVDMAGRRMLVPETIRRVYTGRPGSVVLYAIAPDLMVSRSLWTNPGAERFLGKSYLNLPFAEGSAEEIIRLHPDVIVNYFDLSPKSIDDANRLSARTGIPVFMVDMDMAKYPKAFAALGNLLGRKEQADRMSAFFGKYLTPVIEGVKRIPEGNRRRVYYAEGPKGLNTDPAGSFHSQVLNLVGGVNVARVNALAGKGMSGVSMEQLLAWDPEIVLVWTGMGSSLTTWHSITGDPLWARLSAVRNGKVWQIPFQPFGWFDRPPGTNRIIGALWLAKLLYPDLCPYDIRQVTREYFSIFYHHDLTDAELDEVVHPLASKAMQQQSTNNKMTKQ